MPYLSLMSERFNPYEPPPPSGGDDERPYGPIFGPFPFVDCRPNERIELGANETCVLSFVRGLVYYAGRFYGRWSLFDGPVLPGDEDAGRLVPFDPAQAQPPDPLVPCECELPGYFHCGIPGIIAHLDNGRLAPDAKVERCGLCRRYPDDQAARKKLGELGLVWGKLATRRNYNVHVYATVRVTLGPLEAVSHETAARMADELFDWDVHQSRAEYADEITEYLVDVSGDVGYARSRRLNADFEEIAV